MPVREIATQRLGGELETFESPLTVLASPAWRGVEADVWLARKGVSAEIYKHYHDDIGAYVDVACASSVAKLAGEAGVGPKVLDTVSQHGLVVMEYLGEGWRAGGLHDCVKPDLRCQIIAAKKVLHKGPKFPRDGDIFSEIASLNQACVSAQSRLPLNISAYLAFSDQARQAITVLGAEKVPCHRDGNTANLMIGPDGQVKLIDFDLSANADPFEDAGCYLLEFFECEPEARQGFEEWFGRFHEGHFQRAMIYGILDDLRWGLIGALMAATSPRRSLEFAKYASWRFMRFNELAQRSHAADRLRSAA
ncbi:phosphotransferase [Mesorhizobium sp. LjRoot246]|uniref:phosphotransferase n=1 Tax=Mesorhizobium sp. LjRoot246 TaxID=3342294 RepID=UPI003F4F7386